MRFASTEINGVVLLGLVHNQDERGSFARSFCKIEFQENNLMSDFPQQNISFNISKGTLRGMHFRLTAQEAKVVRCTRGAIYDVVLDLRPTSATYRRWIGFELSAENGDAVYIPPGCAHGFQTVTDAAEVLYLMGAVYEPGQDLGVRYDDPAFSIRWPLPVAQISQRDLTFPPFLDSDGEGHPRGVGMQ